MQETKLNNLFQRVIEYCFYLLFFFVPLVLTPFNYELFEFNKMILTYALSVFIVGFWLLKMVANRKIIWQKTPLDIPLFLFLASQLVSTVFSIDRHVSLFGYYSRFNGGLISTIAYLFLYWAFVSNFPKEKIGKLFFSIISSAVIVSIYGILEHFGVDKHIWVQDVQLRVFSTLGQPNWLAAYLVILISLLTGLVINQLNRSEQLLDGKYQISNIKNQKDKGKLETDNLQLSYHNKSKFFVILFHYLLIAIFFLTLIYTKSRSGFLGFCFANLIFWLIFLLNYKKSAIKPFLILNSCFLILMFLFGTPFSQINRFTLTELIVNRPQPTNQNTQPVASSGSSVIEVGITESSTIRKIVWRGAIDIFKNNPLIGTGVETFAFSYYKFRPVEHNLTSEWDFLYNKAHNEFLNMAATTGIFGLGSYLLIIIVYSSWSVKNLKSQILNLKSTTENLKYSDNFSLFLTYCSLFSAYTSILVTNFFGFSVVIIQLFFYLIPAIAFVYHQQPQTKTINDYSKNQPFKYKTLTNYQKIIILILVSFILYLLFSLARIWFADTLFAKGYQASRAQELNIAYQSLKEAINLRNDEPLFYDELSYPTALLSLAFHENKEATFSAFLSQEAVFASDLAVKISPNNVNFWKTRTRVFYTLSQIEEKFLSEALSSLQKAKELAPTDPKISYNLAVLLSQFDKQKEALEQLEYSIKIKPDYKDAYLALALLYEEYGQKDKARETLNLFLQKVNPNDEEAKKKLQELK